MTLTPDQKKQAIAWLAEGCDLVTVAQHFGLCRDELARQINNVKHGGFAVTYDIVTPESAENGDTAETGVIYERGAASLRDCIGELFKTRTNQVGGIECVESEVHSLTYCIAGYVRVINSQEFETGAQESRWLHFPASLTPASARRLAKLLNSNH